MAGRTRVGALALALSLSVTLAGAGPASAEPGDVVRRGWCTGAAEWRVKARLEDGRIETEGRVDSNRSWQTWRWRILHDGSLSARGRKATKPPSGSFEVRRLLVNMRGTDSIVFRARNPRTGEVCRGTVNV